MTSITIYGGAGEVGGNKILLEDRRTKVFLDFGTSFFKIKKFSKDPFLRLNFLDKLVMGILPEIEGIYNKSMLEKARKKLHEKAVVSSCIVTHSHMDHFGDVAYLDPSINFLCSRETYAVISSYEDVTRNSDDRQWTYYQPPAKIDDWIPIGFYFIDDSGKVRKTTRDKATHKRVIHQYLLPPEKIRREIKTGNKFRVDDLEVNLFPVDHSAFDAHSMLINTRDSSIAYTGDIRFHGFKVENSFRFVKKVKNVDVLITEGTKINENVKYTEYDAEKETEKILRSVEGLAIIDFPDRNIDYLKMYKKLAENVGRCLVISQKYALFLLNGKGKKNVSYEYTMAKLIESNYPELNSKLYVFEENPKPKTRARNDNRGRSISDYPYKKYVEIIDSEKIRKNPNEFIVHLSFYDFDKIVDFSPPKGSALISNTPEPFDEESTIDEARIENWCKYFNLNHYHIHSSGHMGWSDFVWMVEEIKPNYIIPVHASKENAMLIKENFRDRVKILEEGQKFFIGSSLLNYM